MVDGEKDHVAYSQISNIHVFELEWKGHEFRGKMSMHAFAAISMKSHFNLCCFPQLKP